MRPGIDAAIQLAEADRVRGVVSNQAGHGVGGLVVVAKTKPEASSAPSFRTRTDAEGHFTFSLPPDRKHVIFVEDGGWRSDRVEVSGPCEVQIHVWR